MRCEKCIIDIVVTTSITFSTIRLIILLSLSTFQQNGFQFFMKIWMSLFDFLETIRFENKILRNSIIYLVFSIYFFLLSYQIVSFACQCRRLNRPSENDRRSVPLYINMNSYRPFSILLIDEADVYWHAYPCSWFLENNLK